VGLTKAVVTNKRRDSAVRKEFLRINELTIRWPSLTIIWSERIDVTLCWRSLDAATKIRIPWLEQREVVKMTLAAIA
jgi:hypothetical protein